MNSSEVRAHEDRMITVELTPDEALALTGVRFSGNPEVKANAFRKIRSAFEKTFDFQYPDKVD